MRPFVIRKPIFRYARTLDIERHFRRNPSYLSVIAVTRVIAVNLIPDRFKNFGNINIYAHFLQFGIGAISRETTKEMSDLSSLATISSRVYTFCTYIHSAKSKRMQQQRISLHNTVQSNCNLNEVNVGMKQFLINYLIC